jgi:hypothetical protein
MRGLVRSVRGSRIGTGAGRRWPCAGRKSWLRWIVAPHWCGPINANTDLQSVDSIHGAATARDPRFAGKSGVGIWASKSLSRSKSTIGQRDCAYPGVEDHATAEHCSASVLCRVLAGLPLEPVRPYRSAKCRYWPETVAPTGRVRGRYQGPSCRADLLQSRQKLTHSGQTPFVETWVRALGQAAAELHLLHPLKSSRPRKPSGACSVEAAMTRFERFVFSGSGSSGQA